jgi:tRNA pseudouridine55 synthase
MRQQQSGKRAVNGIVLLDKPSGETSNRSLQRVKRLYAANKAGHTGSLDPLATGMLPICFGSATKVSGYLLESAKEYSVTAELETSTDTGDADGSIVEWRPVGEPDRAAIESAITAMLGESRQIPPMYSALKHQGTRMYEYARRGVEIDRPSRHIVIHHIALESVDWPILKFSVRCSKGTYVRSLVGDIAQRLNTVGHVTALRRTAVDPFVQNAMVSMDSLMEDAERGFECLDRHVSTADSALLAWPATEVNGEDSTALVQGRTVSLPASAVCGMVRIYGPGRTFIGLGELEPSGLLRPKKIFSHDKVE